MKRILPFIIILVVLGAALGSAWYLTRPIPASPTISQPARHRQRQARRRRLLSNRSSTKAFPEQSLPTRLDLRTRRYSWKSLVISSVRRAECFIRFSTQMHEEFGDRLRITFREFPLANHQHARAAASAAEAAGIQGKFWAMHDLIYERQNAWKDAI